MKNPVLAFHAILTNGFSWLTVLFFVMVPNLSQGQERVTAVGTAYSLSQAYQKGEAEKYFGALRLLYPDLNGLVTPHMLYRKAYNNPFLRASLDTMYRRLLYLPAPIQKINLQKSFLNANEKSLALALEGQKQTLPTQKKLWDLNQRGLKVREESAWMLMKTFNELVGQASTNDHAPGADLVIVLDSLRNRNQKLLNLYWGTADLAELANQMRFFRKNHLQYLNDAKANLKDGTSKTLLDKYIASLQLQDINGTKKQSLAEQAEDVDSLAVRIMRAENALATWAKHLQEIMESAPTLAVQRAGVPQRQNLLSPLQEGIIGINGKITAVNLNEKTAATAKENTGGLAAATASYEAQLLNSLADFIVTRFKEELTLAFFERFHTLLKGQTKPANAEQAALWAQLRTMFPKTLAQLNHVPTGTYAQMLPTLRMAFARDLQQLAFTAPNLLIAEMHRFRNSGFTADQEKTIRYIAVMLRALRPLSEGQHPAEVLAQLETLLDERPHQADSVRIKLQPVIRLASFISEEMRDPNPGLPGTYWLSANRLHHLFPEKQHQDFLLGVAFEHFSRFARKQWASVPSASYPAKVFDNLKVRLADTARFRLMLNQFQATTASLEAARDTLERIRGRRPLKATDLLPYYKSAFKLGDFVLAELVPDHKRDIYTHYNRGVDLALETHFAALEGRFDVAVVRLTEMMDHLLVNRYDSTHQFFRYTSFLATMAQASDEKTMRQAIKSVVLPPGSYTVKRRSVRSLSLNAFAGATGGWERANGRIAGHLGPSAPIGLAYNWGSRTAIKNTNLRLARNYQAVKIDFTQQENQPIWEKVIGYYSEPVQTASRTVTPAEPTVSPIKADEIDKSEQFQTGVFAMLNQIDLNDMSLPESVQRGIENKDNRLIWQQVNQARIDSTRAANSKQNPAKLTFTKAQTDRAQKYQTAVIELIRFLNSDSCRNVLDRGSTFRNWRRITKHQQGLQFSGRDDKTKYLKGASHTVFLSFIDLGAMANARLKGDFDALPAATFTQVFSPGLYYVYGIKQMPFSAFIGPSFSPDARKNKEGYVNAARLNLGFVVDIPMLHLFAHMEPKTIILKKRRK